MVFQVLAQRRHCRPESGSPDRVRAMDWCGRGATAKTTLWSGGAHQVGLLLPLGQFCHRTDEKRFAVPRQLSDARGGVARSRKQQEQCTSPRIPHGEVLARQSWTSADFCTWATAPNPARAVVCVWTTEAPSQEQDKPKSTNKGLAKTTCDAWRGPFGSQRAPGANETSGLPEAPHV